MPSVENLQREQEGLQIQYNLLSERIERLRVAYAIEVNPSTRFQIEQDLKQAESDRNKVEQQIEALEKIKPSQPLPLPPPPSPEKQLIQTFRTRMLHVDLCLTDQDGQLWVSDKQQVKVFQITNPEPVEAWLLPSIQYKYFMRQIWQNHFLCSDWNGNLFMFNGHTGGERQDLYKAKGDDLPIHCLAVGSQEQLAAATWDGKILTWNAEQQPILARNPVVVPYLPTHLVPGPHYTAVLDQIGYLRLLDAKGQQQWIWHVNAAVRDTWAYESNDGQWVGMLLTDSHQVIQVKSDETRDKIQLDGQVVDLSHRYSATNHQWTALAIKGGVVDWLSWSPFRLLQDNRVSLDFEIRQIVAVYDPRRPNALVALGLTEEGQLFSLDDRKVELYATPVIRQLLLDSSGRFMFWLLGEQIEVYRNPVISQVGCKADYVSVDGTLTVGAYSQIGVVLKNTGTIPIYKVRAQLQGDNRIEASHSHQQSRILPDELINLKFAVRALAAGSAVPLELHIELEDEAGPPTARDKFEFTVESK